MPQEKTPTTLKPNQAAGAALPHEKTPTTLKPNQAAGAALPQEKTPTVSKPNQAAGAALPQERTSTILKQNQAAGSALPQERTSTILKPNQAGGGPLEYRPRKQGYPAGLLFNGISMGLGTTYFALSLVYIFGVIGTAEPEFDDISCVNSSVAEIRLKSKPDFVDIWQCEYIKFELGAGYFGAAAGGIQMLFCFAVVLSESIGWRVWMYPHFVSVIILFFVSVFVLYILAATSDRYTISIWRGTEGFWDDKSNHMGIANTEPDIIHFLVTWFCIWGCVDFILSVFFLFIAHDKRRRIININRIMAEIERIEGHNITDIEDEEPTAEYLNRRRSTGVKKHPSTSRSSRGSTSASTANAIKRIKQSAGAPQKRVIPPPPPIDPNKGQKQKNHEEDLRTLQMPHTIEDEAAADEALSAFKGSSAIVTPKRDRFFNPDHLKILPPEHIDPITHPPGENYTVSKAQKPSPKRPRPVAPKKALSKSTKRRKKERKPKNEELIDF